MICSPPPPNNNNKPPSSPARFINPRQAARDPPRASGVTPTRWPPFAPLLLTERWGAYFPSFAGTRGAPPNGFSGMVEARGWRYLTYITRKKEEVLGEEKPRWKRGRGGALSLHMRFRGHCGAGDRWVLQGSNQTCEENDRFELLFMTLFLRWKRTATTIQSSPAGFPPHPPLPSSLTFFKYAFFVCECAKYMLRRATWKAHVIA